MLSIVYVSNAVVPFTEVELAEILASSRANNAARGLTGMLLYKDGQFMQALEGSEDAVHERYNVIAADPRHTAVRKLLEEQIDSPRFAEWTMAFRSLSSESLSDVPGYDDYFDGRKVGADDWDNPSRARLPLEWFRHRSL